MQIVKDSMISNFIFRNLFIITLIKLIIFNYRRKYTMGDKGKSKSSSTKNGNKKKDANKNKGKDTKKK